jgi:hypothetical protein
MVVLVSIVPALAAGRPNYGSGQYPASPSLSSAAPKRAWSPRTNIWLRVIDLALIAMAMTRLATPGQFVEGTLVAAVAGLVPFSRPAGPRSFRSSDQNYVAGLLSPTARASPVSTRSRRAPSSRSITLDASGNRTGVDAVHTEPLQ